MGQQRRYCPNKSVFFVTSRTEEGLPFITALFMNFLIWGILARGRELYKVKVCHLVFMANHFHMVLVVEDPEDVTQFVGYIKGETSHVVNRLRGRKKKTIWEDGFEAQHLLDVDIVKEKIAYTYANPAKAGLVESIAKFPGVSTWKLFTENTLSVWCKRIARSAITKLATAATPINEQKRMVADYAEREGTEHEFILEPNAWMDSFEGLEGQDPERINQEILDDISLREKQYAKERATKGKSVIGATALMRESINKEYIPETHGRKKICASTDPDLTRGFIELYKSLCKYARKVYEAWKRGDFSLQIPPGMVAPNMPRRANALAHPL